MIYLGFLLVSVALGTLLYDKTAVMKKEKNEYSAFLALLICFKTGLASERRTPCELFAEFRKRREAADIPWLSRIFGSEGECPLEETESAGRAEERCIPFMRKREIMYSESYLSKEDKELAASFFLDFGKQEADAEIKRLDSVISAFSERERAVRESCEKNVKAQWLLFLTVTLGIFIIML